MRLSLALIGFVALLASPPALAAAGPVDVFLVAGQSNAKGAGDASASPQVPADWVLEFYSNKIRIANDPVGGASTGSAWPAFGIAYHTATGRRILFVPCAVGSTAQEAAADSGAGNWDVNSPLLADSMTEVDVAMAAAAKAGYAPVFKGVLWVQGERDGEAINNAMKGVSQAGYETALKRMIATYRAHFGSTMAFFLFKTGTEVGLPDTGFAAVRAAQEDVGQSDPYAFVVFRGAYDFWWRLLMKTDVHYTQAGYNEMGMGGGNNVSFFRSHPVSPKPPTASPGTGVYNSVTNVTLAAAGSSLIVYTLDGSTPDCGKSVHYTRAIAIAAATPTILQAVGCRGTLASPVANFTYNYSANFPNMPQATPKPASYPANTSVTLTSSNATSIRWAWTTSGITPNCAAGTVYDGKPIPLSPSHESLRAVACNGAYTSSVASFGYTIIAKTW
ncbi:MAG TPA: sialate O-acetylesterase [Rhizomicrobium sp.]|jgi:hypothetical protein